MMNWKRIGLVVVEAQNLRLVADMRPKDPTHRCDCFKSNRRRDADLTYAWALLVEAAPVLLAELERIVGLDVVEKDIEYSEDWTTTRDIIARAKGETR
jgi:hypothetical protein